MTIPLFSCPAAQENLGKIIWEQESTIVIHADLVIESYTNYKNKTGPGGFHVTHYITLVMAISYYL